MSLYGMVHGENPVATQLLLILGLSVDDVGRYRDAYLNADGSHIIIYTRNGGGNREEYEDVFEALRQHLKYLRDWDDDFDSTYAYIEFAVPDEFLAFTSSLATGKEPKSVGEKFEETIKRITSMTSHD